ncbi:MAG: hypothetical protein PHR24_02415 [Oscillospiraceae bacterium]|nr:hypothetical protein [Oscillospiraceae bacterium]
MLSALIHNGNNTLVMSLPTGFMNFQMKLLSIGMQKRPQEIKLTDREEDQIKVKLFSDSDIGNHLIRIFNETDTLSDVNITANMIASANDHIKSELEQNIIHDQYGSPKELLRDIKEMTEAAGKHEKTFYCPLMVQIPDEDGELYEIDNDILLDYEQDIRDAIQKEQHRDGEDMAKYYWGNDGVKAKLVSAEWDVEQKSGELFGSIHVRFNEPLTDEETAALKSWISGQNSDGLGEGFEQRPVETEDGDLYISYWHSGDSYFLYDKDEMENYLDRQQSGGMQL